MPIGDIAADLLFALLAATMIVPAGAELIGVAMIKFGCALARHGVALRAAYYAYAKIWRQAHGKTNVYDRRAD